MSVALAEQLRRLGVYQIGLVTRVPLDSLSEYLDLTDQHIERRLPTDPRSTALRVAMRPGRVSGSPAISGSGEDPWGEYGAEWSE